MPIKPKNKKQYPSSWPQIREQILARADHKCEWCGVPNYSIGYRDKSGVFVPYEGNNWTVLAGQGINYQSLERMSYSEAKQWVDDLNEIGGRKYIVIVLTIAHIYDKDPANCDFDNLAALCQQCHNRHDAKDRAMNRRKNNN